MNGWIELDCHPRDLEHALKDIGHDNKQARRIVHDVKKAQAMIATWPYEDSCDTQPTMLD